MKKIIATLAAATMLASTMSTAFAGSRLNPTELSDRQLSLIEKFHADKDSGEMESFIWFRVNNEIIEIPKREFAKFTNKSQIDNFIKSRISAELGTQIEVSYDMIDSAQLLYNGLKDKGMTDEQAKLIVEATFPGVVFIEHTTTETVTVEVEVPVYVDREVVVEVVREVIKEVPVEVIKEVPVEVIKEVIVEKIVTETVEVEVEVIKEIEKIVEVEVEKIVEVVKEVVKEVPGDTQIVEVIKEVVVEVEVPVIQEVIVTETVEVQVPVEVIVEKIVEVETVVEKIIEVEKIVEVTVEVPVEVIKEVEVIVQEIVEVEVVKEVIVNAVQSDIDSYIATAQANALAAIPTAPEVTVTLNDIGESLIDNLNENGSLIAQSASMFDLGDTSVINAHAFDYQVNGTYIRGVNTGAIKLKSTATGLTYTYSTTGVTNWYYGGTTNALISASKNIAAATAALVANVVAQAAFENGYHEGFAVGYGLGYAFGYSEGYEDGYNDGYADGFADGVESVN